jgi:hypothetical protein
MPRPAPSPKMVPVERPDLWNNVVHITGRERTDRRLAAAIRALSPEKRLEGILREGMIRARRVYGTPLPVACFTETTPSGLERLFNEQRFEPWGIVFSKEFVYDQGGAPVHYVRSDEWNYYRKLPASLRARAVEIRRGQSEWLWEREWRALGTGSPAAFRFRPRDIHAVIVAGFSWPQGPLVPGPDGVEEALPDWMPNTRIWHWSGGSLLRMKHWPQDSPESLEGLRRR